MGSSKLAISSVNKLVHDYCLNKTLQELAVITGNYEITFFSLFDGKPKRIIDLRKLSQNVADDIGSG